jgi:putative pyruvate formate lyase activating enzyme
MRCDYC